MKKNLFQICGIALLVCLFAFVGSVSAQTVKTIATSGEWVVPTEDENHNPITVTSVTFEAWGGGGAGSYVNIGVNQRRNAGGGGGGGAYAKKTVNNPVGTYIITVGQGGTSIASSGATTHGQATTVSYNGQTILSAAGGKTAVATNAGYNLMGANGGRADDCIGDDPASGANGSNANIPSGVMHVFDSWTSGAGGNAGGASNPESGTGGASKTQQWQSNEFTGGSNGNPGLNYGGGGGGAIGFSGILFGSEVAVNGGAGAQGVVRVTYTYENRNIEVVDQAFEQCASASTVYFYKTFSNAVTLTNVTVDQLTLSYEAPANVTINQTYPRVLSNGSLRIYGSVTGMTTETREDTVKVIISTQGIQKVLKVAITTYAPLSAGTISAGDPIICQGSSDVTKIISTVDATGGKNPEYKWRYRPYSTSSWSTSITTYDNDANTEDYTPIVGNYRYQRIVTDSYCGTEANSNEVIVERVNPDFNAGNLNITRTDTVCPNDTRTITLRATISGTATGVYYTYIWQERVNYGSWQTISTSSPTTSNSDYKTISLNHTAAQEGNIYQYRYRVRPADNECQTMTGNGVYKVYVSRPMNYQPQFDDETITLWYGALDTTFVDMEAPTFNPQPTSVAGPYTDQAATTIANDRYTPGEYTVYWKVTDPCGNVAVYDQTVTVEYPECGTEENGYKPVTDADGKEYKTLRYVSNTSAECWMIENLRTNTADGTYYDDDEAANGAFGKLYSWNAAVGAANGIAMKTREYAQGACPDGWAIPTQEQFNVLFGMFDNDVLKMKSDDQSAWLQGEQGTNESKFAIMGAGYYDATATVYKKQLGYAGFWTADESVNIGSQAASASISYGCDNIENPSQNKANKLSIRCVRVTPYVTIQ